MAILRDTPYETLGVFASLRRRKIYANAGANPNARA